METHKPQNREMYTQNPHKCTHAVRPQDRTTQVHAAQQARSAGVLGGAGGRGDQINPEGAGEPIVGSLQELGEGWLGPETRGEAGSPEIG